MTTLSTDVAIIGAGIIGSATAYALKSTFRSSRSVLLIEMDTSYRYASTPRSAGGIRQQFSTPENIALSQATLAFVKSMQDDFGVDADVGFKERGYLLLAGPRGREIVAENVAIQQSHGASVELAGADDLSERFSWLSVKGLTAGAFSTQGEGWADPALLMGALRKRAIGDGARLHSGTVTGLAVDGSRVKALQLADGTTVLATAVVIAAGAASGAVAAMAGARLPVEPRKRYVYVIACRAPSESLSKAPLTVDPSGVWFRPEGAGFICGVSPDESNEPAADDLDQIDEAPFYDVVWPTLAERVPEFEAVRLAGAWAGYYDYNTFDQNALIGRLPGYDNLLTATGYSGHGFQQAIGSGRGLAELIEHGRFRSLDLSRLSPDRVERGIVVRETNVI